MAPALRMTRFTKKSLTIFFHFRTAWVQVSIIALVSANWQQQPSAHPKRCNSCSALKPQKNRLECRKEQHTSLSFKEPAVQMQTIHGQVRFWTSSPQCKKKLVYRQPPLDDIRWRRTFILQKETSSEKKKKTSPAHG
jgi:hypothetical protein